MRTKATACAARAPKNPPVRPAGARFVRLGLHLIALWLSCSTACELWTALLSHHNAGAGRSWQAVEQPSRSTIRCSPSLTKRAPAGRTGGFWGARAAHAAAFVRMREGAATCLGLQWLSEPRSTGFWSATCPVSQAGHCAARGSRAHHRADQLADWPRGQQSDFLSYAQIMSSVTRYWPELASLSSFARILKAYHPFQIESYPPI